MKGPGLRQKTLKAPCFNLVFSLLQIFSVFGNEINLGTGAYMQCVLVKVLYGRP